MAEDRREQELRAAAKQLAGVQRQHRPDQTAVSYTHLTLPTTSIV